MPHFLGILGIVLRLIDEKDGPLWVMEFGFVDGAGQDNSHTLATTEGDSYADAGHWC